MPLPRARALRATPELQRILSLPRRKLSKVKAERYAAELTPTLALRKGAELRAWQGWLLHEAPRVGGLVGALPVGQGKTLPCELLPVVMASKRAVLILPAGLRNKTYADRRSYAGVWRCASPPPRMVSREELALDSNALLLDQINPDLIIIDEAHRLSNYKSAATRRIDRFLSAKRKKHGFGSVRVVAMTGTLTRKTIMGYWHLLRWCLGDAAPVPASRLEAEQWAAVLDEGTPRTGFRPAPGPLGRTVAEARAWYLDRLEHTPGVMLVDEDSAEGIPLTIEVKPIATRCAMIGEAFDNLLTYWESPSGEPVTDALSLARITGQSGCGYFTYWKPPPPPEWLAARREVAAFIRKRIAETSHSRKPLDTDAQVIAAHPDAKYYCDERKRYVYPVREWLAVKKQFNPLKSSRVKWFSDATVEGAVKWLRAHERAGRVVVIWTLGVELGKRVAEAAGVPYYGREGRDPKSGRELHAADVRKSMVCSWAANMQGFNLQAWTRQGILQMPPSALYLEQIIGRAHRALQTNPVRITIFATSGGVVDDFRKALREARFAKDTAKNTQKILRADVKAMPELPEGLRWVTKEDADD